MRISKLRSSTFFWAPSMRRVTILLSMASPSFMPRRVRMPLDPIAGEDSHQVVFQREEEPAAARIALSTATSAELQVDAARFVALGADDV